MSGTAKEDWDLLLDRVTWLGPGIVVWVLEQLAAAYTDEELHRAYLHRQRRIDRERARRKVRAEGGAW